ncbi:outer membrane protein assembly factor BamB family protein [Haloarcula argentinensis]|uniref:PQQ-like beta-propeller repeat protein n=1 Tax=Haloarcula argentinensis TaxID=43776 RepID=A0ABU2F5N6_HALAR|nr:PQQ-binding-like beta-propeller repeat protein [Haloarcula argentinensis]MDS0255877.1 PQQ-like beta-propeller repeat protein [Haloarcula argentinensis]
MYSIDAETGTINWSQYFTEWITDSPTVDSKSLYVSAESKFYAVSREKGNIQWKLDIGNITNFGAPVVNSPLVDDTLIYFAGQKMDTGNFYVFALRKSDGHIKWKKRLKSVVGPAFGEGVLIVPSYAEQKVYALSPDDGSERFSIELPVSGGAFSPITVSGNKALIGTTELASFGGEDNVEKIRITCFASIYLNKITVLLGKIGSHR